jgi:hypothetical protein
MNGRDKKKMEPRQEHEKRVVLETIVSLLPREKNTMSVSFLSMLLRAAIYLDTSLACRLDLEGRMAAQLGQAVLDDLLIPSSSPEGAGATAFDVDAVQRILAGYLEHEGEATRLDYNTDDDFVSAASPPNDVGPVGRLMESYLAEISSDVNLPVDKFTALAELIPERSRFNEDGMYRAIDIYLKVRLKRRDRSPSRFIYVFACSNVIDRSFACLSVGASGSERRREKEGVQRDGLPEAVAGGVRARGAERPAARADGGAGAVPRAEAPPCGALAAA